ncbi:ArnT family glycosyltransferase [Brevundimonas aveniformis]|uniref:ArnT family glycosyltransferase n=1 Tax=Brevundimonas aveniformis TaxID=370977 RepID=UPI0003FF53D4|nr:glycosyltransferase family 39 protein [Brevundimonas aveniformis]
MALSAAASSDAGSQEFHRFWRLFLWLTLGITVIRLAALFVTPLELYPDEAQYWLWSRDLAFGYFSKPPMLAWLIALTTGIGGDSEPFVRLSSSLLHAATGLILFRVGARLYDERTGFWGGVLYLLMPGVQLSVGIASTDAPLLFFAALALWAYVAFQARPSARTALFAGLALGGAFLSKYASLYLLIGVALHLISTPSARAGWTPMRVLAAATGLLVVAAPNLIWNALHDFSTVSHTAANANWNVADLFHPGEALEFLVSQTMVLGPVPFAAILIGAGLAAARRFDLSPSDRLLLAFVLPPLILVFIQALLSRANANWAAVAYTPAVILAAAWLLRWHAYRWFMGGLAFQIVVAVMVLVFGAWPHLADRAGLGSSFKRVRGWEVGTTRILDAAEALGPGTVIAADDRFLYNSLAYYGRDRLSGPDAPELTMWVREAHPQNQAEAEDPLTVDQGHRVLMASIEGRFRHEFEADFVRFDGWTDATVRLDPERTRDLAIGIGEGFAPQPRDPETGLPVPVSPTRP